MTRKKIVEKTRKETREEIKRKIIELLEGLIMTNPKEDIDRAYNMGVEACIKELEKA